MRLDCDRVSAARTWPSLTALRRGDWLLASPALEKFAHLKGLLNDVDPFSGTQAISDGACDEGEWLTLYGGPDTHGDDAEALAASIKVAEERLLMVATLSTASSSPLAKVRAVFRSCIAVTG